MNHRLWRWWVLYCPGTGQVAASDVYFCLRARWEAFFTVSNFPRAWWEFPKQRHTVSTSSRASELLSPVHIPFSSLYTECLTEFLQLQVWSSAISNTYFNVDHRQKGFLDWYCLPNPRNYGLKGTIWDKCFCSCGHTSIQL